MSTEIPEEVDRQRAVQSVEVGGRLLLALANSDIPSPLKDVAARAGLSASPAHPYLVSYQRLGLVEQEAGTGRYALGPSALQIGLACLHQLDPMKAAVPIAEELAHTTGHSVAVSVWGNFGPTIVRLFEARQPLHVSLRVGTIMSVLGTATGRHSRRHFLSNAWSEPRCRRLARSVVLPRLERLRPTFDRDRQRSCAVRCHPSRR